MMLYIKYMVSLRCKTIVKSELLKMNLLYFVVDMGTVDVMEVIDSKQLLQLKHKIKEYGMELVDRKDSLLIERILDLIIKMIHYSDHLPTKNYDEYISDEIGVDFADISSLFNEVMCITVQQYINLNRTERVKEFLLYDQYTIKEIAAKLNYRNVAELRSEFKKNTGLPLAFFKQLKAKRKALPQKS